MKNICLSVAALLLFVCGCSDDDGIGEIKCTCSSIKNDVSLQSNDDYLLTCIYSGDLEAVKSVVKKQKLNKKKVPYAVSFAVKCGNAEILEWLLDNGWDANPEVYDSALATAYKVNCKVVKVLLENDAELNEHHEVKHWINEKYKRSPLHFAIKSGNLCMVKATLDCDVDADPGSSYYPPLMEAIHMAHSDILYTDKVCRLLVKYGADPDRKGEVLIWQNKKKINPAEYLMHYSHYGSFSLLSFLMDQGADVEIKSQNLEKMVSYNDVLDEDNDLLDDYPEVRANVLRTYLSAVCEDPAISPKNEKEIERCDQFFRAMKKCGINFNHPLPGRSETPLLLAAKNGQKELCKLLIKYGASPDKKVNGVAPSQYMK